MESIAGMSFEIAVMYLINQKHKKIVYDTRKIQPQTI